MQALLQKADVLFAAGDFEYAMVQYHRGMMIRPDQSQFRLGVQKSKNAIEESNGLNLPCYFFHHHHFRTSRN